MSIRNLRGAPTFGESSTLDIHDLGGGGGEGHRRRSQSSRFLPSQYQHVAGEAIGSSYANQTSSSMFSSFRKPRSRTVSHEFVIKSSSSGELEQPPPPPSSPSPSSSLIFRKFRSSTWDATGIPRLSPKGRANPSDQKSLPDAPPFGGSDYPHNNKLDEQGDERKQFALKSVNGRDISDYDIYFDDSSSSESEEYASKTESHMAVQMLDLQPKAPLSSIECLEELESNNLTDNSTNSAVYQVEDTITKNEVADLEKREKRWSMDSSTSETFHGSKKGVTFAKGLTEYEISDNEYEEKNNEALVDKEDDEENSVNHHSSNQRNALPVMNLPSSQRLSYQYSSPQQQYQQQQQQQKFGHFAKLNPASNLSWSLIGSYIVRTAPCFWCMKKLSISATDREILIRLNVLCSFFCIIQIGLGLFLFITSLMGSIEDRDENKNDPNASSTEDFEARPLVSPDLWNLTLFVYMLSIVNAVLLIASVLAQRAIREVNLVGSVKFMWSLLWLLPIQIFLMIGLFDYYRVMEVWIKHWWDDPSMVSVSLFSLFHEVAQFSLLNFVV